MQRRLLRDTDRFYILANGCRREERVNQAVHFAQIVRSLRMRGTGTIYTEREYRLRRRQRSIGKVVFLHQATHRCRAVNHLVCQFFIFVGSHAVFVFIEKPRRRRSPRIQLIAKARALIIQPTKKLRKVAFPYAVLKEHNTVGNGRARGHKFKMVAHRNLHVNFSILHPFRLTVFTGILTLHTLRIAVGKVADCIVATVVFALNGRMYRSHTFFGYDCPIVNKLCPFVYFILIEILRQHQLDFLRLLIPISKVRIVVRTRCAKQFRNGNAHEIPRIGVLTASHQHSFYLSAALHRITVGTVRIFRRIQYVLNFR